MGNETGVFSLPLTRRLMSWFGPFLGFGCVTDQSPALQSPALVDRGCDRSGAGLREGLRGSGCGDKQVVRGTGTHGWGQWQQEMGRYQPQRIRKLDFSAAIRMSVLNLHT